MRLQRGLVGAIDATLGRRAVRVVLATLLLVVTTVLPAAAGNGPTDLVAPSVSPTSGTTETKITFAVTFRSAKGSAPDYVRVVVGSQVYEMRRTAGDEQWKQGVRYTLTRRLPVGRWPVRFEAADGHLASSAEGDTVTITKAAAPKPKASPKPDPTPKPKPSQTPEATARPTEQPDATSTPQPTAGPSAAAGGLALAPQADPYDWPVGSGAAPDDRDGDGGAAVLPWTGGSGGPGGAGGGGGAGTGDGNGSFTGGDGPFGGPATVLSVLAEAAPTAIVTTGTVTMAMAFLVFGKRRRDGEPTAPDDVLAASAARGSGLVPSAAMAGASVMPNAAAAASAVQAMLGTVPAQVDEDAHLPRWRRPSLMEARKTDPLRSAPTSVRLTFDGDVGRAITGMERRIIRYRLVSLLSSPDEVRGVEIGVLDEGDEVVLLEKRGTYWRVLCPDGREGWLHKMTLGDVVIDSSTAGGDSWTAGDGGPVGGFEDVLRAYTERRRQLGEA